MSRAACGAFLGTLGAIAAAVVGTVVVLDAEAARWRDFEAYARASAQASAQASAEQVSLLKRPRRWWRR